MGRSTSLDSREKCKIIRKLKNKHEISALTNFKTVRRNRKDNTDHMWVLVLYVWMYDMYMCVVSDVCRDDYFFVFKTVAEGVSCGEETVV